MMKPRSYRLSKASLPGLMCLLFFFIPLFGEIEVTPEGDIPYNQTITIRITPGASMGSTVQLEMVREINRDGGGKDKHSPVIPRTPVTDGVETGPYRDYCKDGGIIEVRWRNPANVKAGRHVIRYFRGNNRIPEESVLVTIVKEQEKENFFSALSGFKQWITDPSPLLAMIGTFKSPGEYTKKTAHYNLWVMDAENLRFQKQLTTGGGCFLAAWSPTGSHIAYVKRSVEKDRLMLLPMKKNEPGGDPVTLWETGAGKISSLLWSPGGERVAFIAGKKVLALKKNGGGVTTLLERAAVQGLLEWNRQGAIVFASAPDPDISTLTPEGKVVRLSHGDVPPDHREIPELWRVKVKSGHLEPVLFDFGWLWLPYLSPGGERLVYVSGREPGNLLWLRRGKNFTVSTHKTYGHYLEFCRGWSPGGEWLVLAADKKE